MRLFADRGVVAETFHPGNVGLAAKPGHLALGVVAVSLLRGGDGLRHRQLAADALQRLLVAERVHRRYVAVALEQRFSFGYESVIEHPRRATIDTVVKLLARGIQANAKNAEATQGISSLLPELAHWTARGQADFNSANEFRYVVAMDRGCGRRIKSLQQAMQVRRAPFGSAGAETFAQFVRALRAGKQALQQRAKIKTRSSDDDGKMATPCDVVERHSRLAGIFARSEGLSGFGDIDEVVWDTSAVIARRLGRSDFEVAIYSNRITADDLSRQTFGERHGERRSPRGSGAQDDDQQRVRRAADIHRAPQGMV